MSVLSRRLRLSINPDLIDKNEANDATLFRAGWVNDALTPAELAERIDAGVAYCCELSGSRRAANFVCSDVISVDVDGTKRIPDVLADPIAQKYLTILYTTPSHTDDVHRFRLVFALPRSIQTAKEMVAATRSLSLRLSGDRSATDAARIFYGSRGSNPRVFDRAIDDAFLDELIAQGLDSDQRDSIAPGTSLASTVSRLSIAADLVVRTGAGETVPFASLGAGTSLHCPHHSDANASAHTVRSRQGGVIGIHCSTCAQTFWPSSSTPVAYDFFDFDKRVVEVKQYFEANQDMGDFHPFLADEDNPTRRGLLSSNVSISQTDYLSLPPKLPEGVIFIKSPKGTGKTERLKQTLAEDDGSVLLIGHRVALIRQSCERLGLDCYLDFSGPLNSRRLGVCLDSLRRLRSNGQWINKFRTVIIDESEQVLSHFLSETMEKKRDAIFVDFKSLLQRAKRIVALDADLGWLSFETLSKLAQRPSDTVIRPSHIFKNDRRDESSIEVFDSYNHLVGELMESLSDGKRVFVTSNSKSLIETLYEGIGKEFGEGLRAIQITSDTRGREEVKAFIMNPGELSLGYQAILTSPSLGTGIDITFPEQQRLVDVVFGFFEANVTTHFDFDQQLARVRHPGSVKVWISPRWFRFDTSVEVIKRDIQLHGLYKSVLVGYDDDGRPIYHTDEPLIDMAALAVSQQRASKNNLRRNFIELKRHQGVRVDFVPEDAVSGSRGKAVGTVGRGLAKAARFAKLIGATTLCEDDYNDIHGRTEENEEVSEHERWCFARTVIERFYREPLTETLIKTDDRGKLRTRVSRFERFTRYAETEEMRTRMGIATDLAAMESSGMRTRFLRDERAVSQLLHGLLRSTPIFVDRSFVLGKKFSMYSLTAFMKECRKLKPVIENTLGLEVTKDEASAIKQLNAVLNVIGLELEFFYKEKTVGKTVYYYALKSDSLAFMQQLSERRRLQPGWAWINQRYGFLPSADVD